MPVMRSLLVFVPAAAITLMLSTPFAVQHALANPIPLPSSPRAFGGFANIDARTDRLSAPKHLASHTTAIQPKSLKAPSRITAGHAERKAARSVPHVPREPVHASASGHGSSNASSRKLALLRRYHRQALRHASNYHNLASNATSASASDPAFQQQASTELSGFSTNFLGFTTVLAELGGDNGTANMDPTNNLETLLESIINANKDILTVTYNLVVSLPIVGPILGPIVYQLKCTLDDLLDIVENLTDAIINAIQPLLQAVLGSAVTATCASGVEVAGLCI
ncbi:hypothetical protein DEU56DRAFT_770828 [Suillus clintonianus]|uniref:uncharacterized protein n=1 Tax=Suillus clintonianus TaxID=1904413 RepID=UPI001B874D75|nr:uncharacterized protein DEU56DRAFT_770828 [Suillus clintonianus]KAG2154859.1 hypothetical protein DEU56DRAFT_770828 [Suillus clintonianus]